MPRNDRYTVAKQFVVKFGHYDEVKIFSYESDAKEYAAVLNDALDKGIEQGKQVRESATISE